MVKGLRKVLFVCTANLDRSPTVEELFDGWKSVWEAKSAGIVSAPGRNALTQALIDWADLVLIMQPEHAQHIYAYFKCNPDKVHVLHVSNKYVRNDPELIQELKNKVPPILDMEDKLRETW